VNSVTWSAPGRANLIGEHTDYNEGLVLPFATAERAALEKNDLSAVGRLLTESHASMRDDFEITTPALDLAVDVALRAGALGARMTGGGFGGAAIALIEAGRAQVLAGSARDAFGAAGYLEPRVRAVVPSAGARKEG
jgi:galactokinase